MHVIIKVSSPTEAEERLLHVCIVIVEVIWCFALFKLFKLAHAESQDKDVTSDNLTFTLHYDVNMRHGQKFSKPKLLPGRQMWHMELYEFSQYSVWTVSCSTASVTVSICTSPIEFVIQNSNYQEIWKSLFTIKQNGSRIERIKGKKTTKQDSWNT